MHLGSCARGIGLVVVIAAAAFAADDAAAPVTSEQLMPLTERKAEFEFTADGGPAEAITYTVERAPPDEGEGVWVVRVGTHRTTLVKRSDTGDVVILREDLHDDDNRLTYDPPIVLVPAKIAAGQTIKSESTMKVTRISSGAHRSTGQIVRTFTLADAGPGRVDTPAGPVAAITLKAHDEVAFRFASSRGDMEFAYAQFRGLVRFSESHRVKKVGLINSTTTHEWSLSKEAAVK